jgi:hypothetical protein
MKNKRKTIPILFNGGTYGTFVEWCLLYFSGQLDFLPFNKSGNSHKFVGNHLLDMSGWNKYLESSEVYNLVRFHPKTIESESLITNIDKILLSVDRAILLYAGPQSLLLNLNNKFEKIWSNGWLGYNENNFLPNLKGWGKSNLDGMEVWEIREFLSYYIIPQHLSETEIDKLAACQSASLLKIEIQELFDNFETVIKQLLQYCNLSLVRDDFDSIYKEWAALQKHAAKDKVVDNIIKSVIGNISCEWEELTIVDEAIIQMRLRDLHQLELKCYNLNVFPTNTNDLRKLLINV